MNQDEPLFEANGQNLEPAGEARGGCLVAVVRAQADGTTSEGSSGASGVLVAVSPRDTAIGT